MAVIEQIRSRVMIMFVAPVIPLKTEQAWFTYPTT